MGSLICSVQWHSPARLPRSCTDSCVSAAGNDGRASEGALAVDPAVEVAALDKAGDPWLFIAPESTAAAVRPGAGAAGALA